MLPIRNQEIASVARSGPTRRQSCPTGNTHPTEDGSTTRNRTPHEQADIPDSILMNRPHDSPCSRFVKTSATRGQVEALPPNQATQTAAQLEWSAPTVRPCATTLRPSPDPPCQDGRGDAPCSPMSTTNTARGYGRDVDTEPSTASQYARCLHSFPIRKVPPKPCEHGTAGRYPSAGRREQAGCPCVRFESASGARSGGLRGACLVA